MKTVREKIKWEKIFQNFYGVHEYSLFLLHNFFFFCIVFIWILLNSFYLFCWKFLFRLTRLATDRHYPHKRHIIHPARSTIRARVPSHGFISKRLEAPIKPSLLIHLLLHSSYSCRVLHSTPFGNLMTTDSPTRQPNTTGPLFIFPSSWLNLSKAINFYTRCREANSIQFF